MRKTLASPVFAWDSLSRTITFALTDFHSKTLGPQLADPLTPSHTSSDVYAVLLGNLPGILDLTKHFV